MTASSYQPKRKEYFTSETTQPMSGWAIYKRLLTFGKKYWWLLIVGVVCTMLMSSTDAAFTWLIKPIINKGFVDRDPTFIHWLPLLILLVFLVRSITSFLSTYCISRAARFIVMNFRQVIFKHLMTLPIQTFDTTKSGTLLSLIIYNVSQVANASSDAVLSTLRELTLVIGLIVVLFLNDWRITAALLILGPLIGFILSKFNKRLRFLSENVQGSMADVTHIAGEVIDAQKMVRIYGGQAHEEQHFNQATQINRQRELKIIVTNSITTMAIQLVLGLPIALLLTLLASPWVHMSAGGFASLITASFALLKPVRRITNVNNIIQKGIAGATSIFSFLDTEAEKDPGTRTVARATGHLTCQNLSFQYPKHHTQIIHDLSLSIKPGEMLAIVGPSGGGKSSLIKLLLRFYIPQKGQIFLDGHDSQDYTLANYRQQFAYVSQDTELLNDTVAHNICYGTGIRDEKKLHQAAKDAYAFEFINELSHGFDTVIGRNGVLLSGGQQQRLAIARAIYKEAPILLLDEATSSLDTLAERQVQSALNNCMDRATTIVIAHRLSTIEKADKILVIEKGRIIEEGTHAELLNKPGLYAKLRQWQHQHHDEHEPLVQ